MLLCSVSVICTQVFGDRSSEILSFKVFPYSKKKKKGRLKNKVLDIDN